MNTQIISSDLSDEKNRDYQPTVFIKIVRKIFFDEVIFAREGWRAARCTHCPGRAPGSPGQDTPSDQKTSGESSEFWSANKHSRPSFKLSVWNNAQYRMCLNSILLDTKSFWRGRKETEECHDFLMTRCLTWVNLWPATRYLLTVLLTVWMTKNDTVNLTCLSLILYNFLPKIIQSLLLSAACIRSSLTDSNQSVCLASRS